MSAGLLIASGGSWNCFFQFRANSVSGRDPRYVIAVRQLAATVELVSYRNIGFRGRSLQPDGAVYADTQR